MTPTEISLRPASEADLAGVGDLYLASRGAAQSRGAMPLGVHSEAEVRAYVAGWLQSEADVWVAVTSSRLLGFARFTDTWLDDLYVHPDAQRQGVGAALLQAVKGLRPDGFGLWVFESNADARGFYRAQGCLELEHTDGCANEERAPDLRMVWPGQRPLAFLRAQIDEVDELLGELLARRAALTAAVQPIKTVADRDPTRELEIVQRVLHHAPTLGADGVAKIMDAIISVSLQAADQQPL